MKRILSLMLTLMMFMSVINIANAEEMTNPWKDLDLSEYKEINMIIPGNKPAAFDEIIETVNVRMKELINTKINIDFVSYGEFGTKLSLFLGSDDYDLVYGAYWFNFGDYVNNGGYTGFDWDFVEKYMPMTAKTQAPVSWREMKYGDKYYGITNNICSISATGVWTRQSILDKYGFKAEDIKNGENLEKLMDAIAADTAATGIYVFNAQGTYPLDTTYWFTYKNHMMDVNCGTANWLVWKYNTGKEFSTEDLHWFATTDEYRQFCLKMAEFYKKGYFPASVISNYTMVDDNFLAGTSALNFGVPASLDSLLQNIKNDTPVFLNCLWDDECVTRRGNYFVYCIGFPPASERNMTRAATALDVMKNDPIINRLLVFGIEGRHYNLIEDEDGKYYTLGPEATDYPYFAIGNNAALQHDTDPKQALNPAVAMYQKMYEAAEVPADIFPVNGFNYQCNYEAELSAVTALFNEHRFSFAFGIFGDQTEAKLDEFINQCKAIGIDDIVNDYRTQLDAFIAEQK
ncbi:MAG: DUF3502 domain-containing protein [Christensenellales bacterium]|jgi:ABC-type glycerol-3-phosphate transport system substrate-binding protein